jgi:hypothetical protein
MGGRSVLNPIVEFVTRIFQWVGRAIGMVIAWLCWPFVLAGRWYTRRGWIVRIVIGLFVLVLIGLYANFFWQTQRWNDFNPDYARKYDLKDRQASAGEETPAAQATGTAQKACARSAIVDAAADLTDFNVNQNQWISSMILYKLGFFGLDWDRTPFFDNKASFQRGINQAVRRTSVELVDTLGRVRGTSQVDSDLQDARGALQFDEYTWYLGWNPPGPKTPTPSYYRTAIKKLRAFNDRLAACQTTFDARADNLIQFVDRIANDIGDPQGSRGEPQQWLVRYPRRRPLLVRLRPALRLLRHADRRRGGLRRRHQGKEAYHLVGRHGGPAPFGAAHPAFHRRERSRGRLDRAEPSDHHGFLYPARPLQPGRHQGRAAAVAIAAARPPRAMRGRVPPGSAADLRDGAPPAH